MTPATRGFLTMAVGPQRYLEMAVDLALSLRGHTALPLARGVDRRHHGFSTRSLMETFRLDAYLKTNSGLFVFRGSDAAPVLEECLRAYREEIRPALRWRALNGGVARGRDHLRDRRGAARRRRAPTPAAHVLG